MNNINYRKSHSVGEKGKNYDNNFKQMVYRRVVWDWETKTIDKILNKYFVKGQQVKHLDFACGTGRVLEYIEDKVNQSIGVDISESMLSQARLKINKAKVLKVDLTKEDINGHNSYTLISAFRFFLNAEGELRENAMQALTKYLDDEGILVFNVHNNSKSPSAIYTTFHKMLKRIIGKTVGNLRTMSVNDVSKLTQKYNLEIVDKYHFGLYPALGERVRLSEEALQSFEKSVGKIGFLKPYSKNIIFVCRKIRN